MMQPGKAPLKALHLVRRMSRGGVETWLIHVLRNLDRSDVALDLLVTDPEPADYDEEARACGARIIYCPGVKSPPVFARNFLRILKTHGPYHIVHSHLFAFSGFVAALAWSAGVPVRISHSHNAIILGENRGIARRVYCSVMRQSLLRFSTHLLAASREAAAALFGPFCFSDPRYSTCYYGIDLAPFEEQYEAQSLRSELRLGPEDLVVLHVGRMTPQKNHNFLLCVFKAVRSLAPHAKLLLAGTGSLEQEIRIRAAAEGLSSSVIFLGVRSDVARIMKAADVMVMPSLHEGLPLVLLEAQAARLRAVISDRISPETDAAPDYIKRLPLEAPVEMWAEHCLRMAEERRLRCDEPGSQVLAGTAFDIRESALHLTRIYRKAAGKD